MTDPARSVSGDRSLKTRMKYQTQVLEYRGASPIRKCPPLKNPFRTLGIGLRQGLRGVGFLVSEVPLNNCQGSQDQYSSQSLTLATTSRKHEGSTYVSAPLAANRTIPVASPTTLTRPSQVTATILQPCFLHGSSVHRSGTAGIGRTGYRVTFRYARFRPRRPPPHIQHSGL